MLGYLWQKSTVIFATLIYIALGLFLMVFPDVSRVSFYWGLAIAAGVYGVLYGLKWYHDYKKKKNNWIAAAISLALFAGAVFCVGWSQIVLSFLPLAMAAVLLVDAVGKIPLVIETKSVDKMLFQLLVIATVLPVVGAVVLFANPFKTVTISIVAFGVALVVDGISDFGILMYSNGKASAIRQEKSLIDVENHNIVE